MSSPGEVDAGTETWPPDDDDEHRSHHRELWDELAARAEQDDVEERWQADRVEDERAAESERW